MKQVLPSTQSKATSLKSASSKDITLTIVIPIYNEQNRIHLAIEALNSYVPPKGIKIKKVIFADDGSDDKTLYILKNAKVQYPSEIMSYSKNRGRGFVVKMGMKDIDTDYAMYLDSDMSIPLENLENFAVEMRKGTDIIAGSKKISGTITTTERSLLRNIVGWGHSAIFSAVLGIWMYDFQGGFKVFSRRVVKNAFPKLRMERWGMDAEVIFIAKKMGYSIKELPITWGHVGQGTKVALIRDIYRGIKDVLTIRFNYIKGYYMPVEYYTQYIPKINYYTL